MARGNSPKHLILPAAIVAAVACVALVQAGTAFVAGRQPPAGAAPLRPGIRYAPSAVGAAPLGAERSSTTLSSAWCLGCVALLCASGSRALCSSASKVDRRAVKVSCGAVAVPEVPPPCAKCGARCTCAAPVAAPVHVPEVQAPVVQAPVAPLIDFTAAPVSQVAAAPAPQVQAAAPVKEPEQEETPSQWAFPSRVGAARFVGATRHSQCHGHSSPRTQRAARRAVGAKLQERAAVEVPEMPFDASTLRKEIQVGLLAASLLRTQRGRESKQSASKCATATTDARIKEDDCLEEHHH